MPFVAFCPLQNEKIAKPYYIIIYDVKIVLQLYKSKMAQIDFVLSKCP
jgi:hypothetical protein